MKICIKTTKSIIPISEDEVEKVMEAMDKKSPVLLKNALVNGSYIISIERDFHAERGVNYGYRIDDELSANVLDTGKIKELLGEKIRKIGGIIL